MAFRNDPFAALYEESVRTHLEKTHEQLTDKYLALIKLREANEMIWFAYHRSNPSNCKIESRIELETLAKRTTSSAIEASALKPTNRTSVIAFHKHVLAELSIVTNSLNQVSDRLVQHQPKKSNPSVTQYGTFSTAPLRMNSTQSRHSNPPKQRRV